MTRHVLPWPAVVATYLAFLLLDIIWLGLVAVDLFRVAVGPVLRDAPLMAPVLLFYAVYPLGLLVLAVRPAIADDSLRTAAVHGAMLGLTAYATFDLTNLAIIRGWPAWLAALDVAWGTLASTVAALAGYAFGRRGP